MPRKKAIPPPPSRDIEPNEPPILEIKYSDKVCQHCGHNLDGGDVYEMLSRKYGKEKANLWAVNYGWSKETPKRFSKAIGVYDVYLDRTIHYICPKCRKQINLFEQ